MAFTRSQAKKQQEQSEQRPQSEQPNQKQQYPQVKNTDRIQYHDIQIDFIDASIEWRKNKIKGENCTFRYIRKTNKKNK